MKNILNGYNIRLKQRIRLWRDLSPYDLRVTGAMLYQLSYEAINVGS